MTSVAASVFASFTTSSSPGGGSDIAQPETEAFGALVGVVSTAPSSLAAAATAMPASELKSPFTAMASLLATASLEPSLPAGPVAAAVPPQAAPTEQTPVAAPANPPAPKPVAQADPAPDILVVQPNPVPATISTTPIVKQPIIEEAPDAPPIVCPAAPDTPAEPAEGAVKEKPLPPVAQPLPRNRKPESPPIISTLAPPAQSPDSIGDATARAAEQAKAEKSQASAPKTDEPKVEEPKVERAADDMPPPTKPDLPAILVLPAAVTAPVAPAMPMAAGDRPAYAPDTKSEAIRAASKVSPDLPGTASSTAPAHEQVIPVEGRGGQPDTGAGAGDDKPSPSRRAAPTGKIAERTAVREASPSFTPALPGQVATPTATAEIVRAPIATIAAQPGRIGQELGVAIAHHVASGNAATGGGETITLRLNPVDMGRIEVKLSFDDSGTLRAVVSADNPAALDMLRRDGADLGRALTDAGVRADAQTLRFDTRSGGGQHGGQSGRQDNDGPQWQRQSNDTTADTTDDIIAPYRPLRTRGGIDMVA